MSGAFAKIPRHASTDGDAGSGAVQGAGQEVQEEEHEAESGPRPVDAKSEEINILSSKEEEDDEEEESPAQGRGKKRAATGDASKVAPHRRLNLPPVQTHRPNTALW